MSIIKGEIEAIYPGIFVHSIRIGKSDNADRLASFYDDLNRQVDEICQQVSEIEELWDGFDAIGFSQGGQILRACIQRCSHFSVRNLITVGAQHQGIMDLPGCGGDTSEDDPTFTLFELAQALHPEPLMDSLSKCSWWQKMVRKSVYSDFVQRRIVQAQYFKDPARMDEYMEKSIFLADINNERAMKNQSYRKRLGSITNFVMFMFSMDQQVIPKESSV